MLHIVATPIGNLEDITLRALRILKEADFILAEDTRNTKKLLSHFNIRAKTISFHEHSDESSYQKIFILLKEGKNLALVTDAGTPAISDPGSRLIFRIRQEMPDEKIVAVPGASSLSAAISIAGLPTNHFYFAGFPPHKKGRQTFFKKINNILAAESSSRPAPKSRPAPENRTTPESHTESLNNTAFIFFESTHRILKALESLEEFCPDKNVIIVREITKIFEEVLSGLPNEIIDIFKQSPEKTKGEFVVMVY